MSVNEYVETYRRLSTTVHDAGLIRRRRGFYWVRIIGWVLALSVMLVMVVMLGSTWYQLIIAALIGIVMAQLALLSHEAAHREIFGSRAWNEWMARVLSGLLGGLSHGWWMAKHNTHHAHPNNEGIDPDVKSRVLVFTPEASDKRRGLAAKLAQYQGVYFIPLLALEGLNLHVAGDESDAADDCSRCDLRICADCHWLAGKRRWVAKRERMLRSFSSSERHQSRERDAVCPRAIRDRLRAIG